MAPNVKYIMAYKAMKALGYSSQIVKPVLKKLLVAYNQNWQHIEDENYTVLVDAILETEECKEKERQKFHLVDEPEEDEPPLKRSRTNTQMVQTLSCPGDSSPHCNETTDKLLLNVENITAESIGKKKMTEFADSCPFDYEIEELTSLQPYQREAKTGIPDSSSTSKLTKKIQEFSHDKSNYSDPLSPQTQLNDNVDTSTSSSIPSRMIKERGTPTLSWDEKNVVHDIVLSSQENVLNNIYSGVAGEIELFPDDGSEFDIPLSIVPPDSPKLLIEGDSSTAKEKFPTCAEVIDLDVEDTSALAQFCQDGSSNAKESLLQESCLDYECSGATKEENSYSNSSRVDIASSSKGEVKLFITYETSLVSKFSVPSLDAVLRRMEEKLLKSYGITRPDFSVMKLMKDICEGFLEAGTILPGDEGVRCADVDSNSVTPMVLDAQDVLIENVNHQVGFCVAPNISMGSVQPQNLTELPTQVPKFQSLDCLDLSRCQIDLSMKAFYGEKNKSILALGDLNSSTSCSMVIIQKQHFPHHMLSCSYYIDDITRGEEDLQISLINELNNEHQPVFKYIPRNITYKSAYVKFLLSRISDENCCSNCLGDCLSPDIPCACAGETGGEFAYTPGGLVKEKFLEECILMNRCPQQKNFFYCQECPLERSRDKSLSNTCKGHLVRKFIKECWYKCGCNKDCGNRVVQRGISRKLQVFMTSEGKGWGLRTLEDLPKGAFICEYVGEIVTNTELFERNLQNTREKHTYPVLLDADWCTEGVLKDEEALCLDATFYGNVARFINHRCYDANLVEIPVEVETPDHHYYHLAFFTTREVDALEELTWDYGIDFSDHTHPVKAFQCCCCSQVCRDNETSRGK